ncbi:hypothetical protein GEV33_001776 [Tenebrio molitor]|uniref:F-box domain-containing protein n=1 Tax=Tenebrio molitor TaxID=7067 RepID=A0A8J6LGJ8_TENMO|nr:hypothetical protein GEV33_001776 [Tenebrio molitor]
MYQILPFLSAANLVLPDCSTLPVELWAIILRLLDPASLLTAVQTSSYWKRICQGDPVLRSTIRTQLNIERRRQQEEILNPGLLITVTRENGVKSVTSRAPTVPHSIVGFDSREDRKRSAGGPTRRRVMSQRLGPYKSIRC